jgi:hypothetical protein
MAAHIGHPPRSRWFIKVYLCTWGLLAVGALAYLTLLAFPPQAVSPPLATVAPPGGGGGTSKEIAEVRGSIGEIRKDVTELKTSVGERVENEKGVKTRLSALEERVSTIDGAPPAAEGDQGKAATKEDEPSPGDASGKSQADIAPPTTPPVIKVVPAPVTPIETGSISPKEEIVFGEPMVTRGGQEFAVQLAAAPSLNALKQSWGQLTERHAGALANLKPRVVGPRADGGIYRLIAGPLPTKADAERVCSELRVGPKACFATPYAGAPL